jgi:hypothetical protein
VLSCLDPAHMSKVEVGGGAAVSDAEMGACLWTLVGEYRSNVEASATLDPLLVDEDLKVLADSQVCSCSGLERTSLSCL